MIRYFVKPDGTIFEKGITSQAQLDKYLKDYQLATPLQRKEYLLKLDEKEAEIAKNCKHEVYYMAPIMNYDGYANSARQMKDRAVKHGFFLNTQQKGQKVGLCYHLPNTLQLVHTPIKISYTMFESTQYPPFWEPYLKSADCVVVPTKYCADVMFQNFGIQPRIIPLGYEPENFYYLERERAEGHKFTFLHYDAFKWRKGWDIIFQAFNEEFGEVEGEGDDVRLVFKTTLGITPPLHEYPKIKVVKGQMLQSELIEILRDADCFVFPSRGEGFGLTPLEALATGMPAIFPNHTGMAHYFNPDYCYDLDCVEVPAVYDNIELRELKLGTQLKPTVASVRRAMRQAYEEWKAKTGKYTPGIDKKAAEHAKQFTIDKTTEEVCKLLAEFV